MKKRLLVFLLTLCMTASMCPAYAQADPETPDASHSGQGPSAEGQVFPAGSAGVAGETESGGETKTGGEIAPCTGDAACTATEHSKDCPLYTPPAQKDVDESTVGDPGIENKRSAEPPAQPATVQDDPGETPAYSKTLVVSNDGFSDIQTALASLKETVGGPVLLQVDKNLDPSSRTAYSIPADKGITSFTIGTSIASGVSIGQYAEFYLYANGVPLIIDKNITFKGAIYGGGDQPVTEGGAHITVNEGARVTGTIYGGGRNSDVTGDVEIRIMGSISSIYGGGYAAAFTNDGDLDISANVDGNISLALTGEGSELSGDLYGGGYAYSSSQADVTQSIHADVTGSVNVTLDCSQMPSSIRYICGGGRAELSAVASYYSNLNNRTLTANVAKSIRVKVAGNTTAKGSSDRFSLWGGGRAVTPLNGNREDIVLENTLVSADTAGDVTVDAAEDFKGNSGANDWDNAMFTRLYGGGLSSGRYTQALVKGSTYVTTSRKATNSATGAFGGGCAWQGGVARVGGDTHLTVCRAVRQSGEQPAGHENAKGIVGGGEGGAYGDATVEGSSYLVVGDNISFEENNGIGMIGGGRVTEHHGRADVLGNVSLTIGKNVTLPGNSAVVGGGCVYEERNSADHGSANVAGNITISVAGGLNSKSMFVGGGYINASSSDASTATVGSPGRNATITTTLTGDAAADKFYFSMFFGGAYGDNSGAAPDVTIYGNVKTILDQAAIAGTWIRNGSYGAEGVAAVITGDATLDIRNDSKLTGNVALGGGQGPGSAVQGKSTVNVDGSACDTVYGGGYQSARSGQTEVNVSGSSITAALRGGGYLASAEQTNLNLFHSSVKEVYGGGYKSDAGNAQIRLDHTESTFVFGGGTNGSVGDTHILAAGGSRITYLYGGGYGSDDALEASAGHADITVADSVVSTVYGGGNVKNGSTRSAAITALGDCTFTVNSSTAPLEGVTFQAGDGSTATDAKIYYIYDPSVKKVQVTNNAALTHLLDSSGDPLFWNTQDLTVEPGGVLSIENGSERISGSFTGGGGLRMKAGTTLTVGGAVSGQTGVTISGTPAEGQTYIAAASAGENDGFTLTSSPFMLLKVKEGGLTKWKTATGITISIAETAHGSVEPSGSVTAAPGTAATFRFRPDYGYKLSSLTVDGQEVIGDVTDLSYDLQVTKACTLAAVFEQMRSDDIGSMIENLPKDPTVDPGKKKEGVLDAKLHYEALPDDVKKEVSPDRLSDLNEKLAQLPEVNVDVAVEVQIEGSDAADVPDAHMLLQSMSTDDAEGIRSGNIDQYTLSMIIAEAGGLTQEQQDSLSASLEGKQQGPQFNISVKKTILRSSSVDEETTVLERLAHPVTLVFDVRDQQPAAGFSRCWQVLNLHGQTDSPALYILPDEDSNAATVTVSSSLFSVYTLAYSDSKTAAGSTGGSGGGSGSSSRVITAKAGDGGSVSPSGRVSVSRGSDKTFTFTAGPGYEIADVLVDGKSVGTPSSYTFKNVTAAHSVEVTFREQTADNTSRAAWNPFTDVKSSDWFYESAKYAYENGLMSGTSATLFSPETDTSRAMLVTILWHLDGSPDPAKTAVFSDVESDAYYAQAVSWAVENTVAKGYGDGSFGPGDPITREQMATVLYQYARYKDFDNADSTEAADGEDSLAAFLDRGSVSPYAAVPLRWAADQGLISGMGDGSLDPAGSASRAQIASVLRLFCQKYSR